MLSTVRKTEGTVTGFYPEKDSVRKVGYFGFYIIELVQADNRIKASHALDNFAAVLIAQDFFRRDLKGLTNIGDGNGENGFSYSYHSSHP